MLYLKIAGSFRTHFTIYLFILIGSVCCCSLFIVSFPFGQIYIWKPMESISSAEFTSLATFVDSVSLVFGHRFNCFTFLIHSLRCFSSILSFSIDSFVGWLLLFWFYFPHSIQPKQSLPGPCTVNIRRKKFKFSPKDKKKYRLVSTAMDPFQCSIWF